ncbi:MAG TPA: DUF6328 family protein [Solirubrobacteraceae bacterium]|nr:DUF6328 family protein [Solirubrobacteraceae bacterium]
MGGERHPSHGLSPTSAARGWTEPCQTAADEAWWYEHDGRDETPPERLDRNLDELTGELRVVVTGVQVLFAFLLIVPFNVGFEHVGGFERIVYFVTLVLTACAALCTLAPSAQHRFLFRLGDKHHLVFSSNRLTIAGLAFLAAAMCGCLMLVTTKLFGAPAGVVATCLAAIPFAVVWFVLPLRRAGGREPGSAALRSSRLRERGSPGTSGSSAPSAHLRRRV